ncbi:LysR family transcriptional regulator [Okibacterium fritillariae]|uniref:DNA-binding transcriptional regulator, LysR family n=1 Tax=Okibacterium fritillariae TaxID=123320 RepID=A0A1T5IB97_9MICO|nr:LysR family transcriptional regulator [Okibacterium fritillariae]SKC36417.1 DNA-binding transcriptional regulator, LysR family [Okibacterium fritillariae]
MADIETRELRYFVAVARELNFGRAAHALGISQPPLSRAIKQLELRLGVQLFERDRRGVVLTKAGLVLLRESGSTLDAIAAAVRRTQRAGRPQRPIILATKAGASHALLQGLLSAVSATADLPPLEVMLCEVGEQAILFRDGRADVALMHRPVDDLSGLKTQDLMVEGQVVIVPAGHPLALREQLTLGEIQDVSDLPLARWPRLDGTYPPGPGPEVRTQSQIAQLVALGKTLLVIPACSRAWQWPDHVAVPVTDALEITTVIALPASSLAPELAGVIRVATELNHSPNVGAA